ncbi:MAG: hypothetical protein CMN73_07170 [Sphingomonas sp.]|nr:hypothetical protein [Sphingomonas sp.]
MTGAHRIPVQLRCHASGGRWALRGGGGEHVGWAATGDGARAAASLRFARSTLPRGPLAGTPCLIVIGVA